MISRYTLPAMGRLWTEERRFALMLKVELLALEAQSNAGLVPRAAVAKIKRSITFQRSRISAIEQQTQHDVIAFLENLGESIGPLARYLHQGLTSSDVLDTALAVQMQEAADLLIQDAIGLRRALARQARRHRLTVMIGRTHGVHAEPTTFGLKLAGFYDQLGRGLDRLRRARATASVGKISGAVGTFAHLGPSVEAYVCRKLKLRPAPISTQIVPRDIHAEYLTSLAVVAGTLEQLAVEIRHLQRTEVLEAEEPFGRGQKGSSAMPHKRNPIACERVAGLARLVRSNAIAALENMALWHERDISHSSVERVILPDSTILLDYMLQTMTRVVGGLAVYPARMRENLERTHGLVFSGRVLIELMRRGLPRREAYAIVQRCALRAWREGVDFQRAVLDDAEARRHLNAAVLRRCCDLRDHTRHVNRIFARVGLGGRR